MPRKLQTQLGKCCGRHVLRMLNQCRVVHDETREGFSEEVASEMDLKRWIDIGQMENSIPGR